MACFVYECCNFLTVNEKMLHLLDNLKELAQSDATILLKGETGVGKEVLACIIHKESRRKNFPFIKINCAAIPDQLLESELFGFEKGSFTGAFEAKKGKILLANKGTLLLDEISELKLELQAKILRVIEYNTIFSLGSQKPTTIDVRFILTTNADLKEKIKEGTFRKDLYYRICPITIEIPPLRERKEDIPLLFSHYFKFFKEKYNKNGIEVNKNSLTNLNNYPFYGNIRELKGLAERIVLQGKGKNIKAENFIDIITLDDQIETLPLKDAIKNFEKNYIKVILNKVKKKKTAAKILKISRKTLWQKLKD